MEKQGVVVVSYSGMGTFDVHTVEPFRCIEYFKTEKDLEIWLLNNGYTPHENLLNVYVNSNK